MNDKTSKMESTPIYKLLFDYGVTIYISLFFSAMYNTVDALFVSRGIGDVAMAGVSLINPFMMLQSAFAQMIGSGAATLISIHLGKREYYKAGNATLCAMSIFYSVSVLTTVLCLVFSNKILFLLGADSETIIYAKKYFIIIVLGNVFSTGFSSIIRAEGRMKYSLLIWLIPTAINIIFDFVFIYLFKAGVSGAALATVLCQFTSFLMSIIFFKKISIQKFDIKNIKFNECIEIIELGISALLQSAGISVITFFINNILSRKFDYSYITSFSYTCKIAEFALVATMSIATAMSPIISYNYSANNHKRVKVTTKTALIYTYVTSIIEFVLLTLFSKQFVSIFTSNQNIINISSNIIKIISPTLFILPVILIVSTYFQAIKNKKFALIINLSLIFSICILAFLLKNVNIWLCIPIGCLFSLILTITIYKKATAKS